MAKTSMKIKQQRPAKFSTREYNRCRICGSSTCIFKKNTASRSFCFRELAYKGPDPWRERKQAGRLISSLVSGCWDLGIPGPALLRVSVSKSVSCFSRVDVPILRQQAETNFQHFIVGNKYKEDILTMSDQLQICLLESVTQTLQKHDTVDVPSSKMKLAIADIL